MTTTNLAYIPSPPQGVWQVNALTIIAVAFVVIAGIVAALIIEDRRREDRDGAGGIISYILVGLVALAVIGALVWQVGTVPVRAYALCILAGIVVALVIGDRRWVARGGEPGVIYDIALWAVPFGLIGGRLYHVMTDWEKYFGAGDLGLAGAVRIWDGGLGIWGAVALGGVGAWIACRRRNIPLPAFGDAIAPGIVLAQGIGRLGNYFNQELYGRSTTLPWGLEIYERRDASGALAPLNGVSTGELVDVVHPTFLYELLWNVLVFVVLIYVDRRFKLGHGRLFALYVAGYCLGRFWIELMRADEATLIEGIRINVFTATFVFIGAVVYIMLAPKGREDPATLRGPVEGQRSFETKHTDEVTEELATVGATSGVVAAAKVAGADEDEDAEAASGSDENEPEAAVEAEMLAADVVEASSDDIAEAQEFTAAGEDAEKAEVSAEAEALGADVAGVPADDIAEAEEFAAEGAEPEASSAEDEAEAEGQAEVATEAEKLAEDVGEAPVEDIAQAEEFAEAGAEPVGGVGAVQGEEVVAAEDAAAEVHDAAVEGAEEAENIAEEVEAEAPSEEAIATDSADAVGGVGAVEGEEVVDAEDAAPEVHEAAVKDAEAEELAEALEADVDESDAEEQTSDDSADAVGGVGAVEGEEVVEAEDAAPEVHEAALEGAAEAEGVAAEVTDDASGDQPGKEAEVDDDTTTTPPAEPPAGQAGGAVRRWLRRRRR